MNKAIAAMLERYPRRTAEEHVHALREVFQELALLGLWRAKFFEHAAFYGGTALRMLYGLDRFSEDIDFSLDRPNPEIDLAPYGRAIEQELRAWGFETTVRKRAKTAKSAIESAFLKANTREQLLAIDVGDALAATIHRDQTLTIRIEVDTDPPPQFETESKFLLQPIPFSVRAFDLPSLFAGKMHALLCRRFKNRVKGRDWYDFVWYVGRQTALNLRHLEMRMRQSGHFAGDAPLSEQALRARLHETIEGLDIDAARADVERFLTHPEAI
ncbi:MAG: nucleotidyl transferase AbiEii/AbiGii toxin family protein, partial [Myxococcales bacterium]|nr:nucleotidyl transferase AbiEii/AbiGii toxin family protein [Myxococcales bacterium]